jgi:hypothetical protein
MYDEHDKRYLDDWRMTFAQLQQRGRRLTRLRDQGVEKTDQTVLALEGEYARLISELERLWKAYYLNRPQT